MYNLGIDCRCKEVILGIPFVVSNLFMKLLYFSVAYDLFTVGLFCLFTKYGGG